MRIVEIHTSQARNYRVGMRIDNPRRSVRARLRRLWRRVTWWRWPPSIVRAIDVEAGVIELQPTRWSWRRWRWERVEPPATCASVSEIFKRHYGDREP